MAEFISTGRDIGIKYYLSKPAEVAEVQTTLQRFGQVMPWRYSGKFCFGLLGEKFCRLLQDASFSQFTGCLRAGI